MVKGRVSDSSLTDYVLVPTRIMCCSCILSDLPPALWLFITCTGMGCHCTMLLGKLFKMAQLLISRCH